MTLGSPSSDIKSPIIEESPVRRNRRRGCWLISGLIGLVILVIVIVVPVVVIKERGHQQQQQQEQQSNQGVSSNDSSPSGASGNSTQGGSKSGNKNNKNSTITNATTVVPNYPEYHNGDGLVDAYAVSKYANLIRLQTVHGDKLAKKQRVFVVGDIHGCLDEFNQLVEKIQYNPSTDQLILAGDLIAKGPSNTGVIRRAKELGALCVRGNHDDKAVRFKTYEMAHGTIGPPKSYMPEGDVLDQLKFKNDHLPMSRELSKDDYDYLASCPSILHIPSMNNSVVVHAGLDPMVTDLAQQQPVHVMTMRDIGDNGRPTDEKKVGTPWSIAWNQIQSESANPITVYYGHDASRGLVVSPYTYGLDTGCVYGKALTAIEMKSKRIFDVSCKKYAET